MPIKQAEMKAIADAAVRLRDQYINDFATLANYRTLFAETGNPFHLETLLERLDAMIYLASSSTAQHMTCVEVYLERYRLTAHTNAANAERKRRARAKAASRDVQRHQAAVRSALEALDATTQGELTDDEWQALNEHNAATGFVPARQRSAIAYTAGKVRRTVEFGEGIDHAQAQPADAGMADLPDIALAEGEED